MDVFCRRFLDRKDEILFPSVPEYNDLFPSVPEYKNLQSFPTPSAENLDKSRTNLKDEADEVEDELLTSDCFLQPQY
uniref:Uncharacterized protein n=1 Tax=Romanomermis culicivorax TaxID=13658 RepID=A0A915HR30_ROMCU